MEKTNKIKLKEKVFYGVGDMSANIMQAAMSFYLLFFMINIGGVKSFYASFIFLAAKAWDAVSDYLMGRISDKTNSKYGKRRCFMLFGAIPFGLVFILLWLYPFKGQVADIYKILYYLMVYLLFNTTWTICYVPYNALTANMTDDYDERSSLSTIRIIMANLGLILGAAVFAFLAGKNTVFYDMFYDGTNSTQAMKYSYILASSIFGVLATILMLICTINVKERVSTSSDNSYKFFETIKQFFKMKEFRCTTLYYLLSLLGFDIIMAIFMFYINDTLGYDPNGAICMIFVALPLIVAIITGVMWDKLSVKYAKHKVYSFAAVLTSLALLCALFVPNLPSTMDQNNFVQVITSKTSIGLALVCTFVGMGMSAVQILPFASIPDIIELDEYVNGVRREGAYYGIQSFMYKLANGISMALISAVLGIFGYQEARYDENYELIPVTQPIESLKAIRIMLSILPGIIFAISIIFAFRANMSRERHNEIKRLIKERKLNNK